jgi:hypothetical protein
VEVLEDVGEGVALEEWRALGIAVAVGVEAAVAVELLQAVVEGEDVMEAVAEAERLAARGEPEGDREADGLAVGCPVALLLTEVLEVPLGVQDPPKQAAAPPMAPELQVPGGLWEGEWVGDVVRLGDTVAPAPQDALRLALPVPEGLAARLREALGGREGVPPLEAVAVRVGGAVRVEAASASAPPAPAPGRGPREAEGRRGVGVAMTVLEREAGREGVGETQAEGVGEDVNKMEAVGDG